jgi:NTE family protein
MQITLALGGGGAKGCAHIGVLRCLQQHHFQIKAIAGTSVGAAIGAVFAAGYSPEEILTRLESIEFQRLFTHGKQETPSLLGFYGLEKLLHEFLGERTFEQLNFPLAVTATDLKHSREVILNQGRVIDALKASMAIPGVFPAQPWNEHLLVDGGVMGNVPVSVARQFFPTLPVVAVVLSSYEPGYEIISPPRTNPNHPNFQQIIRLRLPRQLNIFLTSKELSTNH